MRTYYEKKYKNNHYLSLFLLLIILLVIVFADIKESVPIVLLWVGLIIGGVFYYKIIRKPENVYYVKIETDEKKIKKQEYDNHAASAR